MDADHTKARVQAARDVLSMFASTARSTQIRLFHGLVPVVVELREASDQLDTLLDQRWVRGKHRSDALIQVTSIKAQIANSLRVIESRSAELGYPLQAQTASYLETRAGLTTLSDMEAALADLGHADWDAWASALTDDPGDAAA